MTIKTINRSLEDDHTPRGKMSIKEMKKSLRDILIISIGAATPQILELLSNTDWGRYDDIASWALVILMPIINRILNLIRVK
jgi:hypothetical protein